MKLINCVFTAAALAAALVRPAAAQVDPGVSDGARRPNIIFILADDLGYGELGCYGQARIKTPELDRMASEGVRFTQFYAASAVCAPSRASLLTGLHTGHTKIRSNKNTVLRDQDRTVAETLKAAGYRTASIGKWALGEPQTTGAPDKQGFDEYLGYMTHRQAHDYTPEFVWKNGDKLQLGSKTYAPDLFTSAALEYVSRPDGKPFFLFLGYTTPHAHNALGKETGNGMEVPSDAPYSAEPWPQPQKNHAAMITRMDGDIGRLLARLRETGMAKNTVVFFSSDNGPHREGGAKPEFFESNGPLRGIKRDLYDGGIRVPMIVWRPGAIRPAVNESPAAFWDFMPTAAELAGVTPETGIDGVSLVAALEGKALPARDYLYWELHDSSSLGGFTGPQQAVRMGDWKAVRRARTELYNLARDPGEENDLAAERPDLVKAAEKLFRTARTVPEDEKTTPAAQGKKASKRSKKPAAGK